ncbi:CRAL TRIO domain containing protein [Asbolus verrucosus]|uniref:CRAL TRIO domain containing protein n=1 Tax=Asbolus verrucosus TaxID=1661398 RepID=A0A482VLD2_ASBVE|nr:CRAL TRIO domain containing protein [Asbolus verrucosus]
MGENDCENSQKYELVLTPVTGKLKASLLSNLKEIPSIHVGDYKFYLDYEEITPEIQKLAEKELRETPDITSDAISKLRCLLQEEKNLHVPINNTEWLIRFLRPCKFYPHSAFELIKRHYQFKLKHRNVYKHLKPSNEKNIFQQNIIRLQGERDQYGRRIMTIKLGKEWKMSEVTLDELFKGLILLSELSLLEPTTQVCGVVIIIDFDGLSFAQTRKFTPMWLKRIVDWIQDCIPLRIKNLHIVNQPYLFNLIYNLIKPFLREKLKKRLIMHGKNHASLHQYVKPELLTPNYGGTLNVPLITNGNIWVEILVRCDEEFEVINSYGYRKKNVD